MADRNGKSVWVSLEFAELFKELDEKAAMDYMRSGKGLAAKHVSVDRRLVEIGKREVEFASERAEFELRKNDIINQLNEKEYVKELKFKLDKLEKEVEHLRALNGLR